MTTFPLSAPLSHAVGRGGVGLRPEVLGLPTLTRGGLSAPATPSYILKTDGSSKLLLADGVSALKRA